MKLNQVEREFVESATHIFRYPVDENADFHDSRRDYIANLLSPGTNDKTRAGGIKIQTYSVRTGIDHGQCVIRLRNAANFYLKHVNNTLI